MAGIAGLPFWAEELTGKVGTALTNALDGGDPELRLGLGPFTWLWVKHLTKQ